MKYRWGFIDNGAFAECQPIVDDSTSINFSQQSNEVFYRAKLNNSIAFRFEFDDILSKGYNYEHIVVLQYFNNDLNDWSEVWRGRFTLTDCEIDFDTQTITVTPETQDRYTKVLDEWETEYNVTKLGAEIRQIGINVRPCLQLYGFGDSKITNYIGNNYWETDCDSVMDVTELTDTFKFSKLSGKVYLQMVNTSAMTYTEGGVSYSLPANTKIILGGDAGIVGTVVPHDFLEWTANCYDSARGQDVTFTCKVLHYVQTQRYAVMRPNNGYNDTEEFNAFYDEGNKLRFTASGSHILDGEYGVINLIYARTLFNADDSVTSVNVGGYTMDVYDFPTNDMAGINLNYGKILQTTTALVSAFESDSAQNTPTIWGLNYDDKYFIRPTAGTYHIMPVAQSLWWFTSVWWHPYYAYSDYIDSFSKQRTIKDGYDLRNVIIQLFKKAGWNGSYLISGILGGTQDYAGYRFLPVITPKSNVITSYYDSPAQNAPITLQKVLMFLRQAYKIYWYIDDNNNIHLEHISYYDNGYKYTEDSPQLLVDLESEYHTNTKNNKVFGQNKVKYEKQDMPAQFTFGWMDDVTKVFQGFAITCLDNYVQKGIKEEIQVTDFTSDIDCILANPSNISKDGFAFFALPPSGADYANSLRVERILVTDDTEDTYYVRIQNAEAAFVKIHANMWRYSLPCENVAINNETTVAKTTGRFKSQSAEFADTVMADVLDDIDNCNKVIRTQQGDGHIKTLSINLNSLSTKADLLFNFVGRWYYLRGTALGSAIVITFNGESVTIDVSDNKFTYRYNEPITALTFDAADVVSVNFSDCDSLDGLTSCANMFKGCTELIAVDFGGKKLGAVIDANDMFAECAELTVLNCPATSTWKPDLNFEDCPLLTSESIYSLIEYLFIYESGSHTLTFNQTMWNALDPSVQTDIEAKANAKGWQIAMAAAYFINGQSPASVVYATINGSAVEIDVENGTFSYGYRNPITSISFEGDANVQTIDFSLTDGLANVTSLDNAFKDCTMLTSVDFTNCDLTNVASASDCFANCAALTNLTIPSNTWKSDVDFSSCLLITYAEMLDIIGGLYTFSVGTHTITWNTTYWDTLTQAQQQTISDAASAKGWQTNAVMIAYTIRGTSSSHDVQETLDIYFIDIYTRVISREIISISVDSNGDWQYQYANKKVYGLTHIFANNSTITSLEFDEDFEECLSLNSAFDSGGSVHITSISMPNAIFSNVTDAEKCFYGVANLTTISLPLATFANLTNAKLMFSSSTLTTLYAPLATFEKVINANTMFANSSNIQTLSLPNATFESALDCYQQFYKMTSLTSLDLSEATFESATDVRFQFNIITNLQTLSLPKATYRSATNAQGIFSQFNNAQLTTIYIPLATFESITTTANANFFNGNFGNSVVNWTSAPNGIGVTFDFRAPTLNYASFLNVAAWLKDMTSLSTQTITIRAVAWNALSTAEQATIQGILQSKNWNLATA